MKRGPMSYDVWKQLVPRRVGDDHEANLVRVGDVQAFSGEDAIAKAKAMKLSVAPIVRISAQE